MLSPEDRIYRFLWPEKLLQRYSLYSIYRYIKDSEVFFSKKNAYLLLKILYAITSNIVFFPISIVLYTFNYKFIYGTMLFQIGEVFSLDIAVKKNILYSNSKLILFFYPPLHDNSYLLSQFDENIIIIRNRFLFLLLMPLSHSILTKIDIVNYDTNCGGGECFMADIANRYQDKFESPLLKLPSKDIVNGYKVINKYIDKEIKIVCVHARESGYREGFYKDENRTTRNSDIATYESLFDELTLLGYVIVRIGDSSMTKCDNFVRKYGNSFIDYAHMDIKSEEMDVFLLSECDFFIACTSGPAEVPSMFGKNTLLLNGYPLVSSLLTRKGDISIFKKIIDTNTKKKHRVE